MGRIAVLVTSLVLVVGAAVGGSPAAESTEVPRGADLLEGTVASVEPAKSTFVLVDGAGARHEVRYSQHTIIFSQDPAVPCPSVAPGARVIVRCSRKVTQPAGDPGSCPLLLLADRVYMEGALARDDR